MSEYEQVHENGRVARRVVSTTSTTTTRHGADLDFPIDLDAVLALFFKLVLFFLAFSLVTVTVLQHIHDSYLYPLSRSMISNPNLIKHEVTYYHASCDESDITAFKPGPLLLDPTKNTTSQAVDNLLRHGMGIFKNLIDPKDADALRNWVLWKNDHLTNDDKIQVLNWQNRYSFAFKPNEHDSIPPVLESIGNHPLLRPTLEAVLGPDPALVELSTITSQVGAKAQNLHSDTKASASAFQYGRTFVNLFSILIPLQDTTTEMGATTVCPGSHRCAISYACAKHAFQVTTTNDIWKAGDGLMYTSDAIHRGSAHHNGPDRVVLVISFASRPEYPSLPSRFSRRLPFGATYAIRWDMTGHTLNDLRNPSTISQPWAALRGLGVYKPQDANWGWDYVQMELSHAVNHEIGYDREALETRLRFRVGFLGRIPWPLQGPVTDGDEHMSVLQTFLLGTLRRCWWILLVLNAVAVRCYTKLQKEQSNGYKQYLGLCGIYAIVLSLAIGVITCVHNSSWGVDIRSGTFAASPFPNVTNKCSQRSLGSSQAVEPTRLDILISDRLNVPRVAAYASILSFHPGSLRWQKRISAMADLYFAYQDLPRDFSNAVVETILDDATSNGEHRFLTQNDFGDWIEMPLEAVGRETKQEIVLEKFKFLKSQIIRKAIPYAGSLLMADYERQLQRKLLGKVMMQWPTDYHSAIKPARELHPVFHAKSFAGLAATK